MLSYIILIAPLLLFGSVLLCMVPIMAKLFKVCVKDEITQEWMENFSVSTYYPMEGLLSSEDFSFLSRQPGFDLSLYRKLRRDRLLIFRQYLNRMITDFNRLHAVARYAVAKSEQDQSEFLSRLVWLKLRFVRAVLRAECSYLLCRIGSRSLAARTMIAHLEEMSGQLNSIYVGQSTIVA